MGSEGSEGSKGATGFPFLSNGVSIKTLRRLDPSTQFS